MILYMKKNNAVTLNIVKGIKNNAYFYDNHSKMFIILIGNICSPFLPAMC